MISLDHVEKIRKLDRENVYESICFYPQQIKHAEELASDIQVPDHYKKDYKAMLMCGMGGSGLGARFIESVYGLKLGYPIERINGYEIPEWVDNETLVICSSFSGTTEETIHNAKECIERGAKWMAIGSGGTLIEMAEKHNVPYFKINPIYNPSKHPRLAIGYSIIGQLFLANSVGAIKFGNGDIKNIVDICEAVIKACNIEVSTLRNPAKKIAQKLFNRGVLFISSEHMEGASHTIKNQLNENAKNFSHSFEIPEMNHHLMEGLMYPEINREYLAFFFIESDLYHKRIKERFNITKDIISKYEIPVVTWKSKSKSKLVEAFELIQFGGFVNYYLGALNQVNQGPIPWVDYMKERLGQDLGEWK